MRRPMPRPQLRTRWSFLVLLLLLWLPTPARADLSPADRDNLTQALQKMSTGWDQPSADIANGILIKSEYNAADWEKFFGGYFKSNPLTDDLLNFIHYPVLGWLTPEAREQLQMGLFPVLTGMATSITRANAGSLGAALKTDPLLRQTLFNTHVFLYWFALFDFKTSRYTRQDLFNYYQAHITEFPQFFNHGRQIDIQAQPYVGALQIQVVATFVSTLASPPKDAVASTVGLSGSYLDLWSRLGIMLLDNNALDARQLAVLTHYYDLIPAGLSLPRTVAVYEGLGNQEPIQPSQWLIFDGINTSLARVGRVSGNPFPAEVPARQQDLFLGTLAHESNHIVNYYGIELGPKGYHDRQLALIAAAGRDQMNYLRSMVPDGFFVDAPQEFFASISNAWFSDSRNALELGVIRFRAGRPHPLNQALFFADIYSSGSSTTYFYYSDGQANLTREEVPLVRNARGQITGLRTGSTRYEFDVDTQGNVTAVRTFPIPSPPIGLTATLVGPGSVRLTWTRGNSDATGHEIERKSGTGAFTGIAALDGAATTYSDAAAPQGALVTYRVRGSKGTEFSGYSNEAAVTVPDQTPPVLSGATVFPPALPTAGGPVTLTVTAADNVGVTGVTAKLANGGTIQAVALVPGAGGSYSGTFVAPANSTFLPQGWTVTFVAVDAAGNAGQAQQFFSVAARPDTEAPSLASPGVSPASLPAGGGPVRLSVAASDNAGPPTVTAQVTQPDGSTRSVGLSRGADGSFSATYAAPSNSTPDRRSYSVVFTARDASGNAAQTSAPLGFTVAGKTDAVAPRLSGAAVAPPRLPPAGGSATLSVRATDNRGVAEVWAEVKLPGGGTDRVVLSPIAGSGYSATYAAPANGTDRDQVYSVRFHAKDADGNEAAPTAPISLTVQTAVASPPQIADPQVAPKSLPSRGGTVRISARVTASGPIGSVWAQVNGSGKVPLKNAGTRYAGTWTAPKNPGAARKYYLITLFAQDDRGSRTGPVVAWRVTVEGGR